MKSGDFDENGEHGGNGQLLKNRQWLNGNSNYMSSGAPWKVAILTKMENMVKSGHFGENGVYG